MLVLQKKEVFKDSRGEFRFARTFVSILEFSVVYRCLNSLRSSVPSKTLIKIGVSTRVNLFILGPVHFESPY